MKKLDRLELLIIKFNEEIHFQSIKMTFVDMIPLILGVGVVYIINLFLKSSLLNLFLMSFELLYGICICLLYTIHYCQFKNINNRISLLFSLLLGFMTIYTHQSGDTLAIALPLLVINLIGIEWLNYFDQFNFKIKYFPIAVVQYFTQLIPIMMGISYLLIAVLFNGLYLPFLITCFQLLLQLLSSIIGSIIIVVLICYCWVHGIHGVSVIGGMIRPFWTQMLMVNLMCVLLNEPMVYTVTEGFFQWFVWIGGSGGTFGLVILCRYFAKSQSLQEIGKEALSYSWYNINEQVIFGLPIVHNKYMKVPFYIVPIVQTILSYMLIYHGLINQTFLIAPWVFPSIMGAFYTTGGSINAVVLVIVNIVLSILIYLPFFIKYDRQLVKGD